MAGLIGTDVRPTLDGQDDNKSGLPGFADSEQQTADTWPTRERRVRLIRPKIALLIILLQYYYFCVVPLIDCGLHSKALP